MSLTNAQSNLLADVVSISGAAAQVLTRFEVAIRKLVATGIITQDGSGNVTAINIDQSAFVAGTADLDIRDVAGAIKLYGLIQAAIVQPVDNSDSRTLGQALLRLATAAR